MDVFSITFEEAKDVIEQKQKADAPISVYDGKEVTKGVGRFGPFIKWDNIFISVSKKYNFDSLSQQDIAALIEEKLKKESEKVVKEWPEEGIHIEKARWGRYHLIKGKTKVELSIEDIALKTGFEHVSSFYHAFKKVYGVTPSKYRKMEKG